MPTISLPHNPTATSSHHPLPYKRTLAYQRDQRDKRRLMLVRELSTVFATQTAAARCGSTLDSSSNSLGQRRRVPSLSIFCPPPLKPVPFFSFPKPPPILTPPAPRPPRAASPLCPESFTPLRVSCVSEASCTAPSTSRVPAPPPPNIRRPPSRMEKADEFLKKAIKKCISSTPEGAMMLKKGPRRAMEDVRIHEEARVQVATMELEEIVRATGLDFSLKLSSPSPSYQTSNFADASSTGLFTFPSTMTDFDLDTFTRPTELVFSGQRLSTVTEDWEMVDESR